MNISKSLWFTSKLHNQLKSCIIFAVFMWTQSLTPLRNWPRMRKQSIPGCFSPPTRPGYEATLRPTDAVGWRGDWYHKHFCRVACPPMSTRSYSVLLKRPARTQTWWHFLPAPALNCETWNAARFPTAADRNVRSTTWRILRRWFYRPASPEPPGYIGACR